MPDIRLKRAYDEPSDDDGVRILVERLWPRGVSKERARLDDWLKELAPSPELRRWYDHDEERWEEFRRRYEAELRRKPDRVAALRKLAEEETVTFVYASRETEKNSARVLREWVLEGDG